MVSVKTHDLPTDLVPLFNMADSPKWRATFFISTMIKESNQKVCRAEYDKQNDVSLNSIHFTEMGTK